ncbi:MAG: PHP domain-containing protein [Crenarchaeota archaeon]|nr:PHP domain-containing protein [Thermoproteota archaeon]
MRNVVKADLHLHTVYSDGANRPEEYVKEALRRGFNIISITDHDTFKGSLQAIKFVKESKIDNIIIVPGAEVRTNIGDILVYCIDVQEDDFPRDVDELADWASDRNCILVPAHPLDIFRHGIGLSNLLRYSWKIVEVYNGGILLPLLNEITYAIARRLSLSCIGNSDAHHISSMGSCYTLIKIDEPNVESVIQSMILGLTEPRAEGYGRRVSKKLKSVFIRRILRTSL